MEGNVSRNNEINNSRTIVWGGPSMENAGVWCLRNLRPTSEHGGIDASSVRRTSAGHGANQIECRHDKAVLRGTINGSSKTFERNPGSHEKLREPGRSSLAANCRITQFPIGNSQSVVPADGVSRVHDEQVRTVKFRSSDNDGPVDEPVTQRRNHQQLTAPRKRGWASTTAQPPSNASLDYRWCLSHRWGRRKTRLSQILTSPSLQ